MRIKLNKNCVFLYFILLPYVKPYNITLIPSLDNIFKVWKVASTLVIAIAFLSAKKKLHKPTLFLFGFLTVWIASLIINNGPISSFINNIMSIAGMALLFERYYDDRKFKINVIHVLYNIAVCFIFLNLLTVINGHPFLAKGLKLDDNANFLGGDNYSAFILITLCGFMFFYDMQVFKKIRLRTWFYSIASIFSLILTFALAGILAHLFLYFAVIVNKKGLRILFKWTNAFWLAIFFVVAVSYLHLDHVMAFLIDNMGKSGFNGRNYIWPMAIAAFTKKPLLGYGGVSSELASTWFIAGANHTHNILLEYPFSTGIIGTAFFGTYFILILRNMKKMFNDDGMRILMCTLTAYIICSILDFYIGLINFYLLLNMIFIFKNGDPDVGKEKANT